MLDSRSGQVKIHRLEFQKIFDQANILAFHIFTMCPKCGKLFLNPRLAEKNDVARDFAPGQ